MIKIFSDSQIVAKHRCVVSWRAAATSSRTKSGVCASARARATALPRKKNEISFPTLQSEHSSKEAR